MSFLLLLVLPAVLGKVTKVDNCDELVAAAIDYAEKLECTLGNSDMANLNHGSHSHPKCRAIRKWLKEHNGQRCRAPCNTDCDTEAHPAGLTSACDVIEPSCDPNAVYRTIDGSCNNIAHKSWGKSNTLQIRVVSNDYDDGVGSPRTKGCVGDLPGARVVSNKLHKHVYSSDIKVESTLSYMVMQVGQFLAHDIILTKMFTGKDCEALECCNRNDANNKGGKGKSGECDPIEIPENDPYFNDTCMNFARSLARKDCEGIRQQVNSQSVYLDLSAVYGSSDQEAKGLRVFEGGKLKSPHDKLPADVESSCRLTKPFDPESYYCLAAGDPRVNEQPGLASIQTLFHKKHNKLATDLATVNPHWEDEQLYQEARKILIGIWQNIVYTEYLPSVLGTNIMEQYNINIEDEGYNDSYDASVDASVINGFGSGALRIGHTQIHREISLVDEDHNEIITPENLANHWFKPDLYHSQNGKGFQHIMRWTASTGCPYTDRFFEDTAHQLMLLDDEGISFDLASANIQRARDHGNPGYNKYREFCRLSTASHFGTGDGGLVDHETEVAELLDQLYDCPGDIDLFPGILTEKRSEGSIIGPLGQCLLATQFTNLREGDRFFYERETNGFDTLDQLNEIKKIKLSTIMCETTTTTEIQRNVFLKPNSQDDYVDCSEIPKVNLNLWQDNL